VATANEHKTDREISFTFANDTECKLILDTVSFGWERANSLENGAPGGSRTHDPLLRRQLLYPTELRAQSKLGV
jgi:hypothetical protein